MHAQKKSFFVSIYVFFTLGCAQYNSLWASLRMVFQISPLSGIYILPWNRKILSPSSSYPSNLDSFGFLLSSTDVTFKYQLFFKRFSSTCSLKSTLIGMRENIRGLLLKASTTTFSFLLMYEIPKSYSLKNSLHRLSLAFKFLWVNKYYIL